MSVTLQASPPEGRTPVPPTTVVPGFVLFDFETASCTDLKKAGAWRYSECPTTEIICLAISFNGQEPLLWTPGMLCPPRWAVAIKLGWFFIAHNTGFEKSIYRNILVKFYSWPDIPDAQWHDTMAVCAMKALPQTLDGAAVVLRLPYQKDKEGSALTKSLSKANKRGYYDRSPETLNRVAEYCLSDVRAELEAHQRLGMLPDIERELWLLYEEINERGVFLDQEFIRSAQKVVNEAATPLLNEFAGITGGLKPTQGAKFLKWLHAQNIHLDNLRAETVDEELEEDEPEVEEGREDLPADARRALSIRRLIGSASVKKLKRMDQVICADGRARGLLQWHGTAPGRSAGRLFQPQNFPRGTIKVDKGLDKEGKPIKLPPDPEYVVELIKSGDFELIECLVGPATETVLSALRHAIVAPDGCKLVAGDYAGIQARVVLALAGQYDKVDIMARGLDIYCDMASKIYKRPIDKKKDPAERHTGKNAVLGLGFQMGWRTFQTKYAKKDPDDFCELVVNTYRKEWAPKVPTLWYGLLEAAVRTVWDRTPHEHNGIRYELEDGWLTCRAPSGSKIWYRNPQPCKRAMPWDETDIRSSFNFQAQKQGHWTTQDVFGGLLTENVVMRMEVDIKNRGMLNLKKAGYPIILEVHDEIICEVEEDRIDREEFVELMLDQDDWVREYRIPVSVPLEEVLIAERYRK